MNFKELTKKGEVFVKKNAPSILTGISIVGTVTLAFMNIYPKVKKIMEEHREEMEAIKVNEVSEARREVIKKERCARTVKAIARESLPTIIISGVSITASVFANSVSSKRLAAVSAAYELSSISLRNLRESVDEVVPKKAKEIREDAAARNARGVDAEHLGPVYSTGRGDVLCKDKYTKIEFRSSMDEIEKSINRLSSRVRDNMWVSLSELYEDLGIQYNRIPAVSRDIGWSVDDLIEGNLPILVVATLDDTGTIPVLALDYEAEPKNMEEGRPFVDSYMLNEYFEYLEMEKMLPYDCIEKAVADLGYYVDSLREFNKWRKDRPPFK